MNDLSAASDPPDAPPARVAVPGAAAAAVLALMAIGGVLRMWPLMSRPLWHDEIMTWKAAATGLASILTWQHHYEHPPLYYLLAWTFMQVSGSDAAWVLRLPAAICGIACIAAIYWLGMRVAGRSAGLITAALVTFDLNAIILSQQARMYTLTVLAVTLTLLAIDAATRPGVPWRWQRWALIGTGLAASFAASHLGLVLWAALPLALMLWLLRRQNGGASAPSGRRIMTGLGVAFATAALWCSVGFVVMLSRQEWLRAKTGSVPWDQRLAGLVNDFSHAYGTGWWAAIMLGLGLVGIALLMRRPGDAGGRPIVLLLLLLVAINALFGLPIQPHGFEPRPRYVIIMQISLWIGAGALVAMMRVRFAQAVLAAGLVAATAWLSIQSLEHGNLPRYRLGEVLERIAPRVQRGDNVIFYPAWLDDNGMYYGVRPTHTPPTMEHGSDHTALPWTASPTDRPTWLIIAYHHETGATDAAPDIVAHLADRYSAPMNRAAITQAVREQPVVVARITSAGIVLVDLTARPGESRVR